MKRRLAVGLILALALAAGGLVAGGLSNVLRAADVKGTQRTGMSVLNEFRCRYAETKTVVVRGVEDDFSVHGREPGNRHPRLIAALSDHFATPPVAYDHIGVEGYVAEYFEPPADIADAIFVISMKPEEENSNDTIYIGDALAERSGPTAALSLTPASLLYLYVPIRLLPGLEGWHRSGPVYWARLENIQFRAYGKQMDDFPIYRASSRFPNLFEYVRSGTESRVVDVIVSDDTAVDFAGMAWCEPPTGHRGLTMAYDTHTAEIFPGVVFFTDIGLAGPQEQSNPFRGDHDCTRSLPLLCLSDQRLPVPRSLAAHGGNVARHWSGGDLKLTGPVRGDAFETISEADDLCSRTFGSGWRVADFHSGSYGVGISGSGGLGAESIRAWVDIKDQPYGVCWTR